MVRDNKRTWNYRLRSRIDVKKLKLIPCEKVSIRQSCDFEYVLLRVLHRHDLAGSRPTIILLIGHSRAHHSLFSGQASTASHSRQAVCMQSKVVEAGQTRAHATSFVGTACNSKVLSLVALTHIQWHR